MAAFVNTSLFTSTFLQRKTQPLLQCKPFLKSTNKRLSYYRHSLHPITISPITCSLTPQQSLLSVESTTTSVTSKHSKKSNKSQIPLNIGNIQLNLSSRLLLSLVPIIMASFLACAKLLYTIPMALSPSHFNAARLLVASLFFLPTIVKETLGAFRSTQKSETKFSFFRSGCELGFLMFLTNFLQILGLRYTGASRAAFLSQLSTVLVPITAGVLGLELLTPRMAFGALMAFGGVGLLTLGASGVEVAARTASTTLLGDGFEILSAGLMTIYMLRMAYHARRAKRTAPMVAVKVCTQAVLSIAWLGAQSIVRSATASTATTASIGLLAGAGGWTAWAIAVNVALVLWAGIVVSAGASWMQTKGQAVVPASEAAVLFASQPVWASVMAAFIFGERLAVAGMAGAAMIITGTVVSSTTTKGDGKKKR